MSDKILVIAPHPDDETLGCAGTLLKHKKNGDRIFWLIMTNIDTDNGWQKEFVEKRQAEIDKVSQMYGVTKTFKLDFPTTTLDTVAYNEILLKVSEVIKEIEPAVVYLPNRSDVHTDHQITFKAAMSCCKNFRAPCVKRILMYETLSETEFAPAVAEAAFIPNVFVDISEYFAQKIEIMKIYASEVMPAPLPRSLETITSLAGLRGSRIGVKYSEAFMLVKEVK